MVTKLRTWLRNRSKDRRYLKLVNLAARCGMVVSERNQFVAETNRMVRLRRALDAAHERIITLEKMLQLRSKR